MYPVMGLESPHKITAYTGGTILINNLQEVSGSQNYILPRIKLKTMPGFLASPPSDNHRDARGGSPGDIIYPSLFRGKPWSVTGELQASTVEGLRALDSAMKFVLNQMHNFEGTWSVEPRADYLAYLEQTGSWYINCRMTEYDPDEDYDSKDVEDAVTAYTQEFQAGFIASDPRFYWSEEVTVDGGDDLTTDNLGNIDTPPTVAIEVSGGTQTLAIYNDTILRKLQLTDIFLDTGVVYFNFKNPRSIVLVTDFDPDNPIDISQYLDVQNSNWWDVGIPGLVPGANNLRHFGANSISVTFNHAST